MLAPPVSDVEQARIDWGCNCGPAAIAAATNKPLALVRKAMTNFATKGYTNPTDALTAIRALGMNFLSMPLDHAQMFDAQGYACLVMVQWTGPWTEPGANPKWAMTQTHWIASTKIGSLEMVYDINCGLVTFKHWSELVVPQLLAQNERRTGWKPCLVLRMIHIQAQ